MKETINICVVATSGVRTSELSAIDKAVKDMLRNVGQKARIKLGEPGKWLPDFKCPDSPDTLLSNAKRAPNGRQVYSSNLLYSIVSCRSDGQQKILFIVDIDLTCKKSNGDDYIFVFGSADCGITVLSVNRFREENDRQSLLKTMVQHELGHILGLVEREDEGAYQGPDELYKNHCTNDYCAMKQVIRVEEVRKVTEQLAGRDDLFCPGCKKELSKYL